MTSLAGAWRLGNWKERLNSTGLPMLARWDYILPWTVSNPPPAGPFQGFERNLIASGQHFPNFPLPASGPGRGINIAVVHTLGLKRSQYAPPRSGKTLLGEERGKNDLTTYPWTLENGYRIFLEEYRDNYLAEDTYVIPILPERDLRYHLQPDAAQQPGGNPIDAYVNLIRVIEDTLEVLGDRLAGFYVIDEPEFIQRKEFFTEKQGTDELQLDPQKVLRLKEVRNLIRSAEYEWRMRGDNDPAFQELTEEQRWALLLPTIVTYSKMLFEIRSTTRQNQEGKGKRGSQLFSFYDIRDFADIHLFNQYPYRRRNWSQEPSDYNLKEEIKRNTNLSDSKIVEILNRSAWTTLAEPVQQVHDNFNLLREELNTTKGQTKPNIKMTHWDYRYAGVWVQAFGAPFDHDAVDRLPWDRTPAPNPTVWLEEGPGGPLQVADALARRMPDADELRFFTWVALIKRSEGMPTFAQFHASNKVLLERHWKVAQEIDYFSDLRISFDRTWSDSVNCPALIPNPNDPTNPIDPWDGTKLCYQTSLPTSMKGKQYLDAFLIGYPGSPAGDPEELWLFVINRVPGTEVEVRFKFPSADGFPDGTTQYIFRPYKLGVVDPDYPDILAFQLQAAGPITISGERIALFKRERYVPPP